MNNYLGSKIRELRLSNNDSQAALADKLSVTRQAISRWETNTSCPDFITLATLARLYDVDINYFDARSNAAQALPTLDDHSKFCVDTPSFKGGVLVLSLVSAFLWGPFSLVVSIPSLAMNLKGKKTVWIVLHSFIVLYGIYLIMIALFSEILPLKITFTLEHL